MDILQKVFAKRFKFISTVVAAAAAAAAAAASLKTLTHSGENTRVQNRHLGPVT